MNLFENITIKVEQEGDLYRAYAYSATENNIASHKASIQYMAVARLFQDLREIACDKARIDL